MLAHEFETFLLLWTKS